MDDRVSIEVADFSRTPFGRYRGDGPESGQVFREDILAPALANGQHVILNIDGVAGLPSSFWEEALGGLIRDENLTLDSLRQQLEIWTSDSALEVFVRLGWRYISEEAARS